MNWHFIMVEPAVPENVGAAARALKTMGFSSLRLVNPCVFREGKAKWVAHASGEILDQAEVFGSLADAVSDVDFVVGTSAKSRSAKADHYPAEELPNIMLAKKNSIRSVAIVFGREESGLTNDELRLCHISTFVSMATAYPSLNLAQAVMLYAYILSPDKKMVSWENSQVAQNKFGAAVAGLQEVLANSKIAKNPNIYNRIFERIALLGDNDINLLMSVLAALSEKYSDNTNR